RSEDGPQPRRPPTGGPANGLPVPSAPSFTATTLAAGCNFRRLPSWLCQGLLVAVLGLVAVPLFAAPPVVPVAGDVSIDDLAIRSTKLEAAGQWAELVTLCEPAARKGGLSPDLFARYDLAKIHCDLARRSAEMAYQQALSQLSENDARRLYAECLSRIVSHHVEQPNFRRLVDRGCLAMEVAVTDPEFCQLHARQATPDRVGQFRDHVQRIVAGRGITSVAEAETIAAWVARAAHSAVGVPPVVTLLEMTAAAVGGLDEYSAFLTTGQLNDLYAQIEGNFVGLGVELKSADDGLLVVHVIPGSPAERSGLLAGDHLVGIAGRAIGGMHVDAAAQLLQGPEGSLVTLAVLRGAGPARAMTVRREHVEVPSIEDIQLIDRTAGVGYLHITSFQKTTAADLDAALRRLDSAGMRSLVIDLRGNPGGLLSAAVDVADLFLDRGLVVATRGRSPEEDFNYTASQAGTWRLPLTVLIDGDSASSSEIFAGAIRDHGRGRIVGVRSYGKGSIQGIFPLQIAGVGMRLTTASFYSPAGRPFSRVGVEPDVWVQQTARPDAAGRSSSGDAALAAAVEVARNAAGHSLAQPVSRRILPR
ncbi:MAG: S41 family peptidase, partial [Pirellulales bacterium]